MIEPSFWTLLVFLLLFSWMGLTGVVRAEFLRGRNLDYVRAARALGVSDARLMARHILPNAMVATLTFLPFILSGSVVVLTSLDFLGFGLPPGSASLGELVAQGMANIASASIGGIPGLPTVLAALILLWFMPAVNLLAKGSASEMAVPRGCARAPPARSKTRPRTPATRSRAASAPAAGWRPARRR